VRVQLHLLILRSLWLPRRVVKMMWYHHTSIGNSYWHLETRNQICIGLNWSPLTTRVWKFSI